ncbi:cytochrome P450 2G1 [Sarcophilus harrisii]|uniref:cytochrome P450 2G1 n=1 Tax=Sarcophilus harrisii TaxID=9305 RepID=UPI001302013F|nr:cytochrome P450 2G1 [Sarcophilus harrisii]
MEFGGIITLFLALCAPCLAILIAWKHMHKAGKLPPGPTPLPFLGNLLQVRTDATFQSFLEVSLSAHVLSWSPRAGESLSKKYGPVFTVYMGPRRVVVLCGHEAVKEALVDQAEEFSGRGELASIDRNFQGHGVALANGNRWKILRRFSLAVLRDFGMGKRSIEERIQEEAGFLIEGLRKTNGAPIDPTFFLSRTVSNVISSVVFGSRFDYEDKQFLYLLHLINESFIEMSSPWAQLYDMYSGIMQYLPGRHNKIYNLIEELKDFIASRVKINEASLDPNSPRDFIDCFLIKMHQEKNNPQTEFNLKNLVLTTLNLFFAGTETVSSTLRYGFLLLMKYPEVGAKVQEEIDHIIGRHRIPKAEDRIQMPYTDAVIHEIQRVTDIVPMGVPHTVIRDTHFRGYILPKVRGLFLVCLPHLILRSTFPLPTPTPAPLSRSSPCLLHSCPPFLQGTDVFPLIGSALRDPKYFKKPDAFEPKHFLDEQGRFKKNEAFVPFASGKRVCLGEAMARMELFLYFTFILQNFSLQPLVPPSEIDITPKISGFGNIPPTYQLCIVAR